MIVANFINRLHLNRFVAVALMLICRLIWAYYYGLNMFSPGKDQATFFLWTLVFCALVYMAVPGRRSNI